MPDARVLSAQPVDDDLQSELSLRPKLLREYIGQQKVKANLEISITAARKRNETLDHVLLFCPPGLGKTTRAGLLTSPLRARFGIVHRLDFYDVEALSIIVRRSADILSIPITPEAAHEIARRARGTPRIAN